MSIELQTQPGSTESNPEATLEKLEDLVEKEQQNEIDDDGKPEYDDDGYEIPTGKIPLDGHFTTDEIKNLIKVAQKEGILKDDVHVDVLSSNSTFGDRVIVEEKEDPEEKIHKKETKQETKDENE
ncbi:hypothetical protein CAAN1_11S00518 [[Candida] anglica]|uniref:Uncharacterized protein n=1 Tax=[Candida] anglica TaxID=148631 RepID=A0ABP0EIA2_9ASCO